ncbi:ExbD/TolR family protein [Caldithrix abyssi]|uniref:Biopolymer transport protein ExbD n=1 Tax=Caldithrix abyssi DSM 13497 TaxID=880073 RepID=H1XXW9_CALAY|nr:biopolymer transporter ExbD [Caldithrix abyssi]APF20655.1 biopolymer transport protein ExbD [Caldithrix abyssi DSM 13497]EHO40844.1 Biopolymer transport protein ExbD/TolR [Caldithrix abyssi DSM 13497]
MKLLTKEKRRLAINLTPLIDVLFILIIFFAVSSTFLEQPGIELDLPKAKSSEGHTTQRVIIYVDKDKNIFLNDNIVSINNLIDEMKKLADMRKDKSIVVKADAAVPHGLVITIMDLLRQQGIYKMVVSTVKPQSSK